MTDKERIDWLQKNNGCALVSDDQGHWAVVEDGFQSLSSGPPDDCSTTFFIKKAEWKTTVRKAIDSAMKEKG